MNLKLSIRTTIQTAVLFCFLGAGLPISLPTLAQTRSTSGPGAAMPKASGAEDYKIGPGDVLAITVSDAPEFTGKFRVSQSGELDLTGLPAPLQAADRTPGQLSKELAGALIDAKLYLGPTVNVFVDTYRSRNVTVVGAVAKPSVYSLERPMSVLEMLSQAGGLLPGAGNQLTIISQGNRDGVKGASTESTRTIDLAKLIRGEDPALNVEVHAGDTIAVSTAEVVYVVGAVTKPGGFVLPDQSSGITALQAIAMAEGMTPLAASNRALIIRRDPNGTALKSVPVNVAGLLSGKAADFRLQANDILFVPVSGTKQTLRAMGQVAMSAANGIAVYGVGYRVGGL